jgi:hypothetical protein
LKSKQGYNLAALVDPTTHLHIAVSKAVKLYFEPIKLQITRILRVRVFTSAHSYCTSYQERQG